MRTLVAVLLLLLLGVAAAQAETCGIEAPCPVEGGSYRVSVPAAVPAGQKLPVFFFYHGHGSSAAAELKDRDLVEAFADAHVLLVVMDASHGFWGHQGSTRFTRDDFAYTRAVIADVRARWPVDERLFIAAGFSNGSSMVWDLACRAPGLFRAYVGIAGEFWRPMPKACDGPVDLLHFHGLSDDLVPLEGYHFRHGSALLGLFPSLALLKRTDGCAAEPESYAQRGAFVLRRWDQCGTGTHLAMAIHPGGHVMPKGWVALALTWLDQVLPPAGQVAGSSQATVR